MSASIVQYFGPQTSKCGYCTGIECSKSHGMHAYRLSCDDYQELIDRGWRRCGNYCYKPRNDVTCCPCYTIKCDALEFKLTKSNKKILRRMNKFLRNGKRELSEHPEQQSKTDDGDGDGDDLIIPSEPHPQLPDKKPSVIDVAHVETLAQARSTQQKTAVSHEVGNDGKIAGDGDQSTASKKFSSSNPPCAKKKKQMRLERRQAKSCPPKEPKVTQEKSLRDFLTSTSDSDKHQLKLSLVHVDGEEFKRTLPQSYELYKKYQIVIHNDPPRDQKAYKDHLQQTPMKHQKSEDTPDMGYGSFHQQYWLDDKLIAVGVIDILPGSVSSVYFFYDPDYSFLSLGTYGSLREIDLVQTIAERMPSLKYYYMGFYIHSCTKMRYKGKLSASYLLCPETYIWVPLTDDIRNKLDTRKYQRLNPVAADKDANEFVNQHVNDVQLLLDARTCITYQRFVQMIGDYTGRDAIMEYGELVGKVCAHRMIYVSMS
ncbi:arginyl-tRNA--protein transferase 1 isoform X1 [Drosophila nasuta]|uniref:Arginyl-tRNA--protein transferase 1 n=1 Tax=Drosophila albomicans TaxID=7291 RepID=A0A6P8X2M9_DROAB|nr:arginyl-tRNA--protein transferase 1 isoform X2 [Drosophila albomicans]XP_060656755.1 arginyl-tRNA--protein transferase 1 isoform X1 [Drosophila nasuta]